MSLLLNDQVRIDLRQDRVSMVRLHTGLLRSKVVARQTEFCGDAEVGEAPWQPALRALQAGLPALGGGRMDAMVVLSNHFVRYALIPWGNQFSNDSEEQAYVRHCFSVTYGNDADDWALRLSANDHSEMQVASAIDQRLLDGLERVAGVCDLRLTSVQPYLMTVFNQWRRRLTGPMVWFVLAEQGRLCLALLKHGQWCSLRTMKIDNAWLARLPNLLERELSLSDSGTERGTVFLFAPDISEEVALPTSDWEVNWLIVVPNQSTLPVNNLTGVELMGG
ncbi:MAG: hypothetical protein ACXW11_06960 [Methylotenera sp.]